MYKMADGKPADTRAAVSPVLAFAALLGACVWVGGFVALVVVARAARHTLEPSTRVAFFRAVGRAYGVVGGAALALALAAGGALLGGRGWDPAALAACGLAAALVIATAAGVRQARGMTRLRRRAAEAPDEALLAARVRDGARRAAVLRAAIGALSLALLALGAALAG
jgi:hypothetical protein